MNIGITGPNILLNQGGAENHAINVINVLNNYHNIIYFPDPDLYNEFKKDRNYTIEKLKNMEESGIKITKYFYDILDNNYNYDEIINIYSREKIDFLYNFDFMDNFIFSKNFTLIFSKKMNLKFGVSLQGLTDYDLYLYNYIYSTIKLSKNFHIFLYRIYQYIDRKITLNNLTKSGNSIFIIMINKNYYENIKIKHKNINVLKISNGINNSNINILGYNKNKKENKIIFFARLVYNKGIFELPKIMRYIIKYYDVKLIIAGKFIYEREKIKFFNLIKKYKLENNIIYKGFLNDNDLYNEISTSKLMIYPSHSDSFSIAILQSLALYTPVIAYNIAGLKTYNDFKAVKLVNEFDYKAMANEAIKILKMDNINDLFDDDITEFIKKHNWYNVAMEYKNIIEKYEKDLILK